MAAWVASRQFGRDRGIADIARGSRLALPVAYGLRLLPRAIHMRLPGWFALGLTSR
jgi:hypothetical protein